MAAARAAVLSSCMQVAHLKSHLGLGLRAGGATHTLTIRAVNESVCMQILPKSAYQSRRGVMSSTPLSNGLGESGQNPLGRNVAHCTPALLLISNITCAGSNPLSNGLGESGQNPLGRNAAGCNGNSNEQTLYINTVGNYNTNVLTSSPFNTSCRFGMFYQKFWQQYMSAGSRIP